MSTETMNDEAQARLKHSAGSLRNGIVLTNISLSAVTDALSRDAGLKIEYLSGSSTEVEEVEDGYRAVVLFNPKEKYFSNIRDLQIKPGGQGVFDFTATYHWSEEWAGNYGPRYDSGDVSFRFHVRNDGSATYRHD